MSDVRAAVMAAIAEAAYQPMWEDREKVLGDMADAAIRATAPRIPEQAAEIERLRARVDGARDGRDWHSDRAGELFVIVCMFVNGHTDEAMAAAKAILIEPGTYPAALAKGGSDAD